LHSPELLETLVAQHPLKLLNPLALQKAHIVTQLLKKGKFRAFEGAFLEHGEKLLISM
jgi:hypothetical protein